MSVPTAGNFAYNGCWLPFRVVEGFEQQDVYEGTRYVCTRKVLTVSALLSPDIPNLLRPGEDMSSALTRIQHCLEQPRKRLEVLFSDGFLISAGPEDDVEHGPMPEVLNVVSLPGSRNAVVRFRVTCHQRKCPENPAADTGITYLAWKDAATIDASFVTTRRRSGQIWFASNFLEKNKKTPDDFQWACIPGIPRGFVREHKYYAMEESGLRAFFEVEDRQVHYLPPAPAVRASGRFELVAGENGAKLFGQCSVKLIGEPEGNNEALKATAIAVAMRRIEQENPAMANGRMLITGTVGGELYENSAEVSLRAVMAPRRQPDALKYYHGWGESLGTVAGSLLFPGVFGLGQILGSDKQVGAVPNPTDPVRIPGGLVKVGTERTPLYSERDRAQSPDPGLRGPAGLRLLGAILNEPCMPNATFTLSELRTGSDPKTQATAPGGKTGGERGKATPPPLVVHVVPNLTQQMTASAAAQNAAATVGEGFTYSDFRLSLKYTKDFNISDQAEQVPNGKTAVIKLGATKVYLMVTYTAERIGAMPEAPNEDPVDPNFVLKEHDWDPGTMTVAPDSTTLIYRTSGVMKYVAKDPALCQFAAPVPAWVNDLAGLEPTVTIFDGPVLYDPTPRQNAELRTVPIAGGTLPKWWQNVLYYFARKASTVKRRLPG